MSPLTLTPGTRLGPLEIVSALGAGGMGEVYRARDSKLNRDVAIKVLLPAVGNDPDRLARFSREAQVLASLNHANIAAIYGLEDADDVRALVMELVEGPTLADRIAQGAIPLADALPIAKQIAEALEAAHEQGIIHRDLKPANIKVRPDGTVKVLDFGLAKALDATVPSGADAMNSPTLSVHATQAGLLLGTAAYMSPEQARGHPVDKRGDIWAFGAVLFEMLIGTRLFEGETVSDTLAAVLRQDIDWTALPPETPPSLVRLLGRCLDRNPKRRLRDIGEARVALDTPLTEPGPAAPFDAGPAEATARRARFGIASTIATPFFVALVAASIGLWRSSRAGEAAVARVLASLPTGVSFDLTIRPMIAVSRDGSKLALAAISKGVAQLYLRPLKAFEARPLPGTEGAVNPFFSPDGAWIGFVADGKLKKTPAEGGPVITLADAPDTRGAVWTDRDTIIFTPMPTTGLIEIPAAGGVTRTITRIDEKKQERTHRWPSVMPDGKTVLFTVGSIEHPDDYDDATLEAVRVDTGQRRIVLKGGRAGCYVATGDLLFLQGQILYAVGFDEQRLETRGSPRPVVDGVLGDTTTGAADYAVSDTGTLAYLAGDPSAGLRRLAWVDMQGKAAPIDVPPAFYADPHVSPDGGRVAVAIVAAGSSTKDIWIVDALRGTSSRLTFGGINRTPIWSHDGQRLYYVVYDASRNVSMITVKNADGSGDGLRIRDIAGQAYLEDLSPDGAMLTFSATTSSGMSGLYRIQVKDDEPHVMVSASDTRLSAISPDGRWFAYRSGESGRYEVFVQSLSGGGRSQASTAGGTEPHWAPDGRALYYVKGSELVMVPIEPGSTFVTGRARTLFAGLAVFGRRQPGNL